MFKVKRTQKMRFIQLVNGFCLLEALCVEFTDEEKTSIAQTLNVRLLTFNLRLRDQNFKR